MRIVVTGARGMLGTDLVCILEEDEHEVFVTDVEELDITQFERVKKIVTDIHPDAVINCAAYTNVDKAELEPEKAFRINGIGVQNLALVCKAVDIDLCHISTDYVFDGAKQTPYTTDDSPNPVNVYGDSKLAGENYIRSVWNKFYILRTSWLYGKYGKNFVRTVLNLAEKQDELKVVDDQIGSPTWTITLSKVIARIVQTRRYGIYHVTDSTQNGISWYEFAKEIVMLSGFGMRVIPIKTEDFSLPAKRPKNSVLDLSALKLVLGTDLPHWKKSLEDFLSDYLA
jgi:dTDP-4-dehydrorhamnose reductase